MDSQILYLIIGVLVGAIAIYFFVKKNGNSGDNNVLSSQLADLIVRFSKVEEATKNISSTQASIDNTFKSIIN
jgi:flagellar basal body-associated protein FliL